MINCLVAVDRNQGIGFEGQMPWPRLSGDMKWFKECTTDNIIIMGSTTWKSLGKPLPNRINVVISRKLHTDANFTYTDPIDAVTDMQERFSKKDAASSKAGAKTSIFSTPYVEPRILVQVSWIVSLFFSRLL